MDRNRRHLITGMAIDESEKRRQQLTFILGGRCLDLGSDDLGSGALELDRAAVVAVFPARRILGLAPTRT